MSIVVQVTTGEPYGGKSFSGRHAALEIGGVVVFSDFVYDTDKDGNRTVEQAQLNLLRVFASRLGEVLER